MDTIDKNMRLLDQLVAASVKLQEVTEKDFMDFETRGKLQEEVSKLRVEILLKMERGEEYGR